MRIASIVTTFLFVRLFERYGSGASLVLPAVSHRVSQPCAMCLCPCGALARTWQSLPLHRSGERELLLFFPACTRTHWPHDELCMHVLASAVPPSSCKGSTMIPSAWQRGCDSSCTRPSPSSRRWPECQHAAHPPLLPPRCCACSSRSKYGKEMASRLGWPRMRQATGTRCIQRRRQRGAVTVPDAARPSPRPMLHTVAAA